MPHSTTDALTPAQRRQEIATILGRGLLRLNGARGIQPATPDSTDQKALDVSAPGDPHVSWLTQPRS
ncbi:MAG TPA: hypothetical protein PLH84_05945 [Candidatus Krumholzibacteria bacterium]|nr:hypothetical protein [Candidatus Krumholzibacteria bacterium]